jgi:hypothetical protein
MPFNSPHIYFFAFDVLFSCGCPTPPPPPQPTKVSVQKNAYHTQHTNPIYFNLKLAKD